MSLQAWLDTIREEERETQERHAAAVDADDATRERYEMTLVAQGPLPEASPLRIVCAIIVALFVMPVVCQSAHWGWRVVILSLCLIAGMWRPGNSSFQKFIQPYVLVRSSLWQLLLMGALAAIVTRGLYAMVFAYITHPDTLKFAQLLGAPLGALVWFTCSYGRCFRYHINSGSLTNPHTAEKAQDVRERIPALMDREPIMPSRSHELGMGLLTATLMLLIWLEPLKVWVAPLKEFNRWIHWEEIGPIGWLMRLFGGG